MRRGGVPIPLYDCPKPLPLEKAFGAKGDGWVSLGRPLESVYIDVGENGWFSREEFATITALGQMEFITPEEIADQLMMELEGRPTGHDVIAALDGSTSGPTYRAGILREVAMRRLGDLASQHGIPSVAFEMLGPPRLSKLLFEAYLWSRLHSSVAQLAGADAGKLARNAQSLIERDAQLRAEIVSVGIPILCQDGTRVYRAAAVVVPPVNGEAMAAVPRGWVDLRPSNCATWVERARRMVIQAAERQARGVGSGSVEDWGAVDPAEPIVPWRMATWIFRNEDKGERIKR